MVSNIILPILLAYIYQCFLGCLICLLLFPVKLNNDIIMTPRSDNIFEINPVKESWTVVVWIVRGWFLSPFQHSVIKFKIISKNNVSSLFSKYHIFVLGSWLIVVYNILKSIILFLILFLSLYGFRVFCLFLFSFTSSSLAIGDICVLLFDRLFFRFN